MKSIVFGFCLAALLAATAYGCASHGPEASNGGALGDDDTTEPAGAGDAAASGFGGPDGSSKGSVTFTDGGPKGSSGGGNLDSGALSVMNADAAPPDPDIAYSVTLTSDSFTVAPNSESFTCQSFANPFQGQQVDIKTWQDDMTPGSHHMFVFYSPNATDGAMYSCSGLQSGPFTFVAQGPHVVQTYPHGIGATIPSSMGFLLNIHYINASAMALTAQVKVTMYVYKSGIVTSHAGMIFDNNINVNVPSDGKQHVYTASCTLPQDVYVLASNSHMHSEATNFVATAGSNALYQTTQWSDPPEGIFSPPLHLSAGTQITWSCTYVNTTGATLTFGETASKNVMCISQSMFYPVTDVSNPTIGCSTSGTSN
jgi:hypothetical protein